MKKILKKAAALFVAAAISLSTAFSAFAQSGEATKTENTLDIYAQEYTPIDKTKLVKWDPANKLEDNTTYYIDSTVKILKDTLISFPQTSTLYLCKGANLEIYTDAKFYMYGKMVIEPFARLTVSGMINFKEFSAVANYGTIVSTASGTVKFSSDFVNHANSSVILSGSTSIFRKGNVTNYGTITFSPKSEANLTGSITNTEKAKLFVKGIMSVTLSGKATMDGMFSLLGEYVNSGTLILEKTVKFYKGADSVFSVSKSSRIIDNRQEAELEVDEDLRTKGIKGIDVSSWQETIDWRKVKNAGIKFAMIRSSFSDKYVDKTFEYNITEAAKAGIDVGVYHYCYALNAEEAREEAKHFIETISPYKITYPVVLDFEDNSQVNLDKEVKNEIAQVFIEEVRKAGYYPMIYSYTSWYENYMDMKALDCEVWVAHWNVTKPSYKGSYGMWQYSCEGKVSGIDVNVDLNVSFKDYAKIIREGGYNNLDKFD
ncbi:MAG: glycoside hydrolase family 25 protein [Oscillospiraceae bacterium]